MLAKGCVQFEKDLMHFIFVRGGGLRAQVADSVFDVMNLHKRINCGIRSIRGIPEPM